MSWRLLKGIERTNCKNSHDLSVAVSRQIVVTAIPKVPVTP